MTNQLVTAALRRITAAADNDNVKNLQEQLENTRKRLEDLNDITTDKKSQNYIEQKTSLTKAIADIQLKLSKAKAE